MFKTIKSKFTSVTLLFILLSVGIPTTFLIYQFRENFKERSLFMIGTTLDVIINGINHSMLSENKNIKEIILQYSENDYITHIRILAKDGTILYSSHKNDIRKKITEVSPDHHVPKHVYHRQIEISEATSAYIITQPILNLPDCQRCHKDGNIIAYLDIDTNLSPAENRFYTGSKHMIFLAIAMLIVLFTGFISFFNFFIDKPLKKVIKALDDDESAVQIRAALALGNRGPGSADAVSRLIQLLKDKDEKVRAKTAVALGKIGEPAKIAIPELQKMLNDENKLPRESAESALSELTKQ